MTNEKDHTLTPLFTGVKEYAKKQYLQFHIPGHKKGKWLLPEFRQFMGKNPLSIDLVNIAPLDDLHNPHGIIQEAQELAADTFGADTSFFSVQGTTCVILAMILSVCKPGDKLILPRNIHKSILSAIIFSGARPVFIAPTIDSKWGIYHSIQVKDVENALIQHPDAKALLIVNPTYYGVAANLVTIVNLAHEYDIPVLVDEAHGAHLHFHHSLPPSAMQAGADMSAVSLHKLGGSMTQSSILHVKTKRVNAGDVQKYLNLLTTTSTSYLLLSSLDVARKNLQLHGQKMIEKAMLLSNRAREEINQIPYLQCLTEQDLRQHNPEYRLDPTKILIHVRRLGLTGQQVEAWLRIRAKIEIELSDMFNILCIITPADSQRTVQALVEALRLLVEEHTYKQKPLQPYSLELPSIPELTLKPREAFYHETEVVAFEQSVGRTIAEYVMIYPPGIPVLLPGEKISTESIAYIQKHIEQGFPVQGSFDTKMRYLRVIKEIV